MEVPMARRGRPRRCTIKRKDIRQEVESWSHGGPPADVACKLLDAHLADDTYRFGDFPEVLVHAKLPENDRKEIADILDDLAAEVEAREAQALAALAKRLRRKPRARSGRPEKRKV